MEISPPDIIGFIGIACVLTTFFLVQASKLSANSATYQLWNMLGCLLILVSLYYDFNLPSAIIQILWFCISAYGLIKNWRAKRD